MLGKLYQGLNLCCWPIGLLWNKLNAFFRMHGFIDEIWGIFLVRPWEAASSPGLQSSWGKARTGIIKRVCRAWSNNVLLEKELNQLITEILKFLYYCVRDMPLLMSGMVVLWLVMLVVLFLQNYWTVFWFQIQTENYESTIKAQSSCDTLSISYVEDTL